MLSTTCSWIAISGTSNRWGEDDLSETGKIVSNIVTTMGIAIAVSTGQYDEEDFDCDDPES